MNDTTREPDGETWDHITGFDPLLLAEFREHIIELVLCQPWDISEYLVIEDGILKIHDAFYVECAHLAPITIPRAREVDRQPTVCRRIGGRP